MKRSFLVFLGLLGAFLSAYLVISALNRQLMPSDSNETESSSSSSMVSSEESSTSSSAATQGQASSGRKTILIDTEDPGSSSSDGADVQLNTNLQ